MPCQILKNCGSGGSDKNKTKLACIMESNESTRMRMGNSEPPNHEDHIAGKGENSLQHYNSQIYSYASRYENSSSKSSSGQGMGKLEKISAWNLTKVKSKKQVIDEARTSGATVHFASLMDICHLYSAPRLARYLQNAWKRHQDTVFLVDIDLGIRERFMFYQTRSNEIILQGTLPVHCIVKGERLRNGEKLYEKQYLSPRPRPKISLKHDLNWSKGNDQGSIYS